MPFIPRDATWYITELVQEIEVEGDSRNVVHKNLVLVRANSPVDAYKKALSLGRQSEDTYQNPKGRRVKVRFKGIGMLNVIHDKLEHGAELVFEERISVRAAEIKKWIRQKKELSVFRPIEHTKGPDYSCKEVLDTAKAMLRSPRK